MRRFERAGADGRQDLGLILIAAAIGTATLASVWPRDNAAVGIAQAITGTAACLALVASRSRPLAVAVFTTAVAVFSPMAVAAMVLAIVNAAIRCRMGTYIWLSGYVIVIAAIHAVVYRHHSAYLTDLIAGVPAVVIGFVARARRERAEIDERKRVEEARAAERRRIAREMHDVLAHRISMVSVHAGALEYHPDAPTDEVAKAAGVIRTSAHAALGELREVINLLRNPVDRGDNEEDQLQPPQPTLEDIPALIEESRQGGTSIRFEMNVDLPATIPAAVGRTAYRIVQEGLTNARKHAPASEVEVDIAAPGAGMLTVSVLTHPSARETAEAAPPGSGTGLIGLRERVALAGGRLDHGPTAEGGYALSATLPT
jgi:signal transduction histidine kinase